MPAGNVRTAQLAVTYGQKDAANLNDLAAKAALVAALHSEYLKKLELMVAAQVGKSLAADELNEQVVRLWTDYSVSKTILLRAMRKVEGL